MVAEDFVGPGSAGCAEEGVEGGGAGGWHGTFSMRDGLRALSTCGRHAFSGGVIYPQNNGFNELPNITISWPNIILIL